ncbi:guanitoxin biosynthesis pre-guanitoxin forming N-methyltransferase GntF [Actinoplanes sp. NPDC049599]|uniref:guanitoxin biosynthesis pre-guanitoxin forming N-methyltransferase GntF n=1 Tax=Actinoplanes sp. NPDC049599 TaxID=3363903 RepID=UPI0037B31AA3
MTLSVGAPTARRGLVRWAVSLGATVASTYALDAVAAATGAALVAAGLFAGLGRPGLVALLVVSYAAWGLGLRVNLRANAALLTATGTSTNVLSKAAYDLARRWSTGERTPRLAAAAGYLGTELAKEAPFYLGAFGAAAVSDAITSDQALIFLSGANLGAALYEYGLARATRAFVRRRGHASFDTDWVPAEYLSGYYRTVEPDELATIAFLVDAARHAEPGRPVLFFGVGPTLHHVFAFAEVAGELHVADLLPANLAEIRRWLDRDARAHDWRPFVRHTLRCEAGADPAEEEVTAREELTRKKITELFRADGRQPIPVPRRYTTVVSGYCAESATGDRGTWRTFMGHLTDLVGPGGLFVTAALRNCRQYSVAGKAFPGAGINERDLCAVLERDFAVRDARIEVRRVPLAAAHGYSAIVLCHVRRRVRPAGPAGSRS